MCLRMFELIIRSYCSSVASLSLQLKNFLFGACQQVLNTSRMPALSLEESAGVLKVKPAGDGGWEIQFDKKMGLLSSWQVITHPFRSNFFSVMR